MKSKKIKLISMMLLIVFFITIFFLLLSPSLKNKMISAYQTRQSVIIGDRNGQNIYVKPNSSGFYAKYSNDIPSKFKDFLLAKEDKYFYYHFGVNPSK